MAKPSRGATRPAASKKKAKKRYGPQTTNPMPTSTGVQEPAQAETAGSAQRSDRTVLQFRPREAAVARTAGARGGSAAKALLQAVDYGYVYTDLKIIGGLAALLFGGLVALSFVIR